ncbi:MAG: 3-keto-5-aminohexanoate cleavage protein [Deltaproteobacteria bacterium]|nr:3-keto-5-aminohexanoate cleavage protein [Deltaproteobacteria bacterium]
MGNRPVVVTVSVTGSMGDRETNPNLPVTPAELAESALGAYEAGASVVHVHVRNRETGKPAMAFNLYEETFQRIRERSDMIINLTTGPGARFIPDDNDPMGLSPLATMRGPEKRVEHVLRLRPELCSLDVGSMSFGPHIFANYLAHVESMAEMIRDAGVKPELEVFDLGHIEIARHLIKTGRVAPPPIFQLCMGVRWGAPAIAQNMITMKSALPEDALWAGFGIGATTFEMVAQSVLLGGNIRVGFEDTFHLEKGKMAKSNKELVEKAVAIARLLGREPATVDEAREMLGLG